MRQHPAHAVDPLFERVIRRRHRAHGTRLRHAVADRQLRQVQNFMKLPHQLGGNTRARGDAGAEMGEALVWHGAGGEELEVGEEHGWDAV